MFYGPETEGTLRSQTPEGFVAEVEKYLHIQINDTGKTNEKGITEVINETK